MKTTVGEFIESEMKNGENVFEYDKNNYIKTVSDIEVFCRVLARDDKSVSNGIYDRTWTKMPLTFPGAKTYSGTKDIFNTEKYKLLDPFLTYSSTANGLTAKFNDFAFYQIKVVFYASDPLYPPKLKSLIASAVV